MQFAPLIWEVRIGRKSELKSRHHFGDWRVCIPRFGRRALELEQRQTCRTRPRGAASSLTLHGDPFVVPREPAAISDARRCDTAIASSKPTGPITAACCHASYRAVVALQRRPPDEHRAPISATTEHDEIGPRLCNAREVRVGRGARQARRLGEQTAGRGRGRTRPACNRPRAIAHVR